MSYKYEFTYPKDNTAAGYVGPINLKITDTVYAASLKDSVDSRDLIKASIQRIIGTNQGERVMEPQFGTKLRAMLFEQLDDILIDDVKDEIYKIISEQEPRIILTDVAFDFDFDNSTIYIGVMFKYRRSGIEDNFDFYIN